MTRGRGAAVAGALLVSTTLLLGCADTVRTYNFGQYHDRWPELIAWHTAEPIEIVVWGNPFNSMQSALDAAVAESFSKRTPRPGSLLPVRSDGVVPSGPYISVVFDTGSGPFGYECVDLSNIRLEQGSSGDVGIHAAICRGGAPLTRIEGSAGGVSGPNDPKLHALLDRMADRLFRMPPTP